MNSTTHIQTVENLPIITNLETTSSIGLSNSKKKKPKSPNFNELFLKTIDATFFMFGNSGRQTLYCNLENCYHLKKEDIPNSITTFALALEDIFGQAAFLLEARIMQALHSKVCDFKYYPDQEELSFVAYVEYLRRYM